MARKAAPSKVSKLQDTPTYLSDYVQAAGLMVGSPEAPTFNDIEEDDGGPMHTDSFPLPSGNASFLDVTTEDDFNPNKSNSTDYMDLPETQAFDFSVNEDRADEDLGDEADEDLENEVNDEDEIEISSGTIEAILQEANIKCEDTDIDFSNIGRTPANARPKVTNQPMAIRPLISCARVIARRLAALGGGFPLVTELMAIKHHAWEEACEGKVDAPQMSNEASKIVSSLIHL